jgi:signal transduction histidine kinase
LVKAAIGVPVDLREVKSFKVGEGVVGWVVQQAATALIPDSSKDPRYAPTGSERRARTLLAAPLRAQDLVLGALVLVRSASEPFTEDHQRLVEAIASQAAVAIDHARLFEGERASRRRAEALLLTAQACSEAVSTPELLQRAVKQVAFAMRAAGAAIFTPDEEAQLIEAVYDSTADTASPLLAVAGRPINAFPLGAALRNADRPLVITAKDEHRLLAEALWTETTARAVVAVPIRWQGRVLAALLVGFEQVAGLDATTLELLDELGRQVALGMERLRLQARVQEQQNEMAVVGERNRIARDLHDGLVQYVYALGLNLEHAREMVASDPAGAGTALARAIEQVNHVLSEMRTFIYQLRPILMQEKEIGQWVMELCERFQKATGVSVLTEVDATRGHELPPDVSVALFRIIQEALSNVYQHAHATHARVGLHFRDHGVQLRIEDDGQGFVPAERREPGIAGGHGLANIEERVQDLGGSVRVDSAPGRGTRLEVEFPVA